MLCGQMVEYDAGFNVPSQTIEYGIVTYTAVNSRGRIEYKTSKVVDEEKITSSLSILYDNI
jgi:hypothetical protein